MDATSIRLPFHDSQQDAVISRLRRMRERSATREEAAISNFLDRSRVVRSRMDWWRGKMRWFVGGESAAKIKANMQVEQSLGREQPVLWCEEDQSASGAYRRIEGTDQRVGLKNSAEFETMARASGTHQSLKNSGSYSIDPLMDAEREYMQLMGKVEKPSTEFPRITVRPDGAGEVLPGGYDRAELAAAFPEDRPRMIEDKKPQLRKLRLMEIHNCERDIEELANEVVSEIRSACAPKEEVKPQLKLVANGSPIAEEQPRQLEVVQPADDTTSVVPAATEVAIIWG